MDKFEGTYHKSKETKATVVFAEESGERDAPCRVIYVNKKTIADMGNPETIKLTVEKVA